MNQRVLWLATVGVAVASAANAQQQPPETLPPLAPAAAPTTVTRGRVLDARGRPLRAATVRVEATTAVAVTDADGRFQLTAPIGATLVIEAPQFQLALATVTGDELDEIVLIEALAETIEIRGEAPPPAPGAAALDREELQRVPGTAGDLVKTLTVMPGVVNQQFPLGYSGVAIRGAAPQDSKVFVDGFEIPVLIHSIGARALLPAESIASLDYVPGGFDVGFGRASSGVVDVTTRPGAERRSAQAEVSMLDGGLLAQGAVGEATRYLVSLRRSTIDLLLPALIPDDADLSFTTVPYYFDGQLRLDHELSSRWQLSLAALGSTDSLELYTSRQAVEAKRFAQQYGFVRVTGTARFHDGPWAATLALSGLSAELHSEFGPMQHVDLELPSVTPRVEVSRALARRGLVHDVSWRVGAEASITRSRLDLAIPVEARDGEPVIMDDPDDTSTRFVGAYWLPNFATWTAASASVGPRLRATMGVRADVFGRTRELALQPRGELTLKLADAWSLLASGGAFRRPPEFQSELIQDDLEAERATQAIGGVRFEPRAGLRVQGSAYYYDRRKLITHEPDGSLGNRGRGHTTGAELLATYRDDAWLAWLSYAYSRSLRVDQPGGEERLFSYDQPHSLNAAASWRSGKWQLGARFQAYSGLPYTPVSGAVFDSDRDRYQPAFGAANSGRAPLHHQLDLRVDRSWTWGPVAMTGFLDIQNVYMNETPFTYEYSYDYSERAAVRSIPILPSLGLRGVL